jgi:hypothetical protein
MDGGVVEAGGYVGGIGSPDDEEIDGRDVKGFGILLTQRR